MYPVPACELPLSISSTDAVKDELLVSISRVWLRTGMISFESGVTVTLTLVLATPSILAGVNQTVMLSLAMVVVASLIGAKGLGQDVLEALQYANVGQGILAGVAILFVALILDRVVQGKKRV